MTKSPNAIESYVEARLEELTERAALLADEYWAHNTHAQQTRPISEWGKHGVRARRRKHSISIDWSRVHFYGPKGNRKPRSVYIPRGPRSYRYNMGAFRDAPDWERELIEQLEAKFALIRQEVAALKELLKVYGTYQRVRERVEAELAS